MGVTCASEAIAVPTDPDDNRVLECAVTARPADHRDGTQTIVTGVDDLLGCEVPGIEIVRVGTS